MKHLGGGLVGRWDCHLLIKISVRLRDVLCSGLPVGSELAASERGGQGGGDWGMYGVLNVMFFVISSL